ncbi:hypothetical protein [Kitasatospora paranensis]|uniref:hypothetical protein n=1 Tax=Kitasatospora paranensis TaxID=258053 RepID=UPI0031F127C2
MAGMAGMAGVPATAGASATSPGDGLAAEQDGYRLDSPTVSLPAGRAVRYPFTITGPDGRPVTAFAAVQTERLHFYAIRSDLTGYQHLHPAMAADGSWTADLAPLDPGSWRLYASFTPETGPRKGREFVLSRTVAVPGTATTVPLPAAAGSTTVDGYTVTVQGDARAGTAFPSPPPSARTVGPSPISSRTWPVTRTSAPSTRTTRRWPTSTRSPRSTGTTAGRR